MPTIPGLAEPLSDGTVALRLAAERDIPEVLIAYQDDPHMHERLGEQRPPSGAQLGRRAEQAEVDRIAGRSVTLTIVTAGSDDCVGEIRVHPVEWIHARGELGIWLAPQLRRRGLAPRALKLAAQWLFDSCGLERLQILTEPANERMVAAARAAGFVDEGVLRGYSRERGKRVDRCVLSLLPGDLRP
jgi:RimJ/RimL family protein N-acetyltransferase